MGKVIRKVYRAVLPKSVRNSKAVAKLKERLLGHDWIYDSDYYENTIESAAVRSAGKMADSIVAEFKPAQVIDVGCGTGALIGALRDRGCEVYGLEYAEAGLQRCRARGLEVAKFDLERNVFDSNRTFDVAVSMEVAEHLPETAAESYVKLLARLSRIIVFTAAPPGQGGTDHVNEQPASYWITKFETHGFKHAEELSERWRQDWQAAGTVESWYYKNLMIFRRGG
jgi:2-polyprenyl-3-methyl-5-hydroxy-6-metoxy-1,4-benzoquinol methylase